MTTPERLITHGVLLAGAIIVAFPFLWMIGTSVKVRREMAAEELRLLPRTPRPQVYSPYVDPLEFEPGRPEGIPEAVWAFAQPEVDAHLESMLDQWDPHAVGPEKDPSPAIRDTETFRTEMKEGIHYYLDQRISDQARNAAMEVERNRGPEGAGPPGSSTVPATRLSQQALDVGRKAILDEVWTLVDERMLRDVFDQCYRRVCLGGLRLRTGEQVYPWSDVKKWTVKDGPAELAPRIDRSTVAQELQLKYSMQAPAVTVSYQGILPVDPNEIERVYVSYRGDASWARVVFNVFRNGRLFETRERLNLLERDWVETELRWLGENLDPMERKPYVMLYDRGPAPEESPSFGVQMVIEKNTKLGAWMDKLTRNYRLTFKEVPFLRYVMTSASLSVLNILLAVFSCSLVAYAFARLEWPGRDLCFALLLSTMMIPPQVTMIPGFIITKYLGWYNTLLPLWIPAAFGAPFFIFLMRQFLKNVPKDLEEAARMDGCGFLRIYWHVMLPLVKPTLATIAIFTFMGVWNNFMGPLIYVNDERLFPLALGLFKFKLTSGANVGLMMAGSFMMTLPIIVLFFFVQRYFIQGISLTGVKG